jgi:hypothetical protein
MDPDATLREIRAAIQRGNEAETTENATAAYEHVAELFTALDEWMSRGGFAPWAWQNGARK